MKIQNMMALLISSMGARLCGAGLGLLTQITIARSFSQSDVGVIFLAMSCAALMSLFVTSGYPILALTELPRLHHMKRVKHIAMLHALALTDWIVLTSVLIIGLALAFNFLTINEGLKLALIFGLLSSPVSATIRYVSAIANSHKLYAATLVPDNIIRPGLFLLVIGAAYLLNLHMSLVAVLIAYVASNAITAISQAIYTRDWLPSVSDIRRPRKRLATIVRSRSLAIAVVAAVATMFADIVTILGGLFLPAEDVGILGITIRLAAIAGFFIQSTQQLVLPNLSIAISKGDQTKSNSILLRLNLLTMGVIVVALVGTIFLGRPVLQIFGNQYAEGYSLLILFMIAQAVRAFSGMNQQMLSIAGKQIRTVWACLTAVAFLIGLWSLFARSMGLIGIGYAVIGSEIVWCIMLASQAKALTGARADLLWILTHSPKPKKGDGLSP